MTTYIIQKKDGVVEYYAGAINTPCRKFTSTLTLATMWYHLSDAESFANVLQTRNKDGVYTVRRVVREIK